jgi:hypothetical protein
MGVKTFNHFVVGVGRLNIPRISFNPEFHSGLFVFNPFRIMRIPDAVETLFKSNVGFIDMFFAVIPISFVPKPEGLEYE